MIRICANDRVFDGDVRIIHSMLNKVWKEPLHSKLPTLTIDVSLYKSIQGSIPDKTLVITEVFPHDELNYIWSNYNQYLSEHQVFPFLGTLGEAVICIGYGEENCGLIFYFDFDFGLLKFNGDTLVEFIRKLC